MTTQHAALPTDWQVVAQGMPTHGWPSWQERNKIAYNLDWELDKLPPNVVVEIGFRVVTPKEPA